MPKNSKRRHKKAHRERKKPSREERRHKSRSPVSKKKEKRGKAEVKASSEGGQSKGQTEKKPARRTRRNDWRWKMKKGKKKGFTRQDWYWGMISQNEAEEFLKDGAHGEFLVRSMIFQETTVQMVTVVSVNENGRKFHHFRVFIHGSKWQLESSPSLHKTVVDLISFFKNNFIGMTKLRLETASKQPDWFIKSYKIICPKHAHVLGSGNFSNVLIGAYRRRLVAVKILTSQGDRLLIDREAMMKEASITNKLQHPYCTKMIGVSIDQMPPMLLVEMMTTDLLNHLERYGKYTTIGEKLLYCWQLASALAFMAKLGIVHRDIAARNALFNRYGILKLSDFGLSDYEIKLTAVNTTKEHLPMKWMAPESMCWDSTSATFNEKTDVWMFGVCCNEIFNNGAPPLENMTRDEFKAKISSYKEGDTLHPLSKYVPEVVQTYFKTKIWAPKLTARPPFGEIVTVFDLWIKVKYPPPSLEKRTVQMIPNCYPLTIAEYEILYENNWDWLPAVRKVKIKKEKKVKSRKSESEVKKKPKETLKHLKRKLIKRRKRHRLRIKLRWWREKRREEKKRIKTLINYTKVNSKRTIQRSNGHKRIMEKHEKLVDLYWKLMMVKWRKREPNRKTRFRLRRHRMINNMSKHPASRNRKVNRFIVKRRDDLKKQNRAKFVPPVFPQMPKFVAKKKKKMKNSVRGNKKEVAKTPKKGTPINVDPQLLEQIRERNKRNIKKRKRHQLRKRNKRKARKKRHLKRKQRRRQKHRRRYRRKKLELRRMALTVDQKERLRSLKKRRDEKQKLVNRLRRDEKIGALLRDWRTLRRHFILRRKEKVVKLLMKKQRQERKMKKSKEPKSKEKPPRSGRKKSKSKSRT